tara:strand:+ start:7980 stop:8387 length:408 start_codon:yes stop_codon:yes gene_type:complete
MSTEFLYFHAKSPTDITSTSRLCTYKGDPESYFVEYSENPAFGDDPVTWVLATRSLVARVARGVAKDLKALADQTQQALAGEPEDVDCISEKIITFYEIRDLWVEHGRQFNDDSRVPKFPSKFEIDLVKNWSSDE